MIPLWILTVLHYTSLVTAGAVLVLIGWQYFGRSAGEKQQSPNIEGERDEPAKEC